MSREEAKDALKAYMIYNASMSHHTYGWCTSLIDQIFDEHVKLTDSVLKHTMVENDFGNCSNDRIVCNMCQKELDDIGDVGIDDIEHEPDCPYILAKELKEDQETTDE